MCRVLISEDNVNVIPHYQTLLTKDNNIEIIGIAKDGEKTLEMYKELKPDLVLLDLGLPKVDGLEVINQLSLLEKENQKCNIVLVSGNSDLRYKLFNTKKVYSIIPKSEVFTKLPPVIGDFISENSVHKFPEKELTDLLIKLKLKPYSTTSTYLISAIRLAYSNHHLLDKINKIYEIIAFKNNCSTQKIKSSIISSVKTVNRFAAPKLLNSIFFIVQGDYNQVLSPKYFVNCLVYYLEHNVT